jgi:hypothetical protein
VRIACQVAQHGLRPRKRRLAVDDPSDRKDQDRRTNMEF